MDFLPNSPYLFSNLTF